MNGSYLGTRIWHPRRFCGADDIITSKANKREPGIDIIERTLKSLIQGGLAAAFDLAAFRKVMIAPVKKSVNHSKTVTSMREMRRIHALWRLDGGKRIRIKSLLLYC